VKVNYNYPCFSFDGLNDGINEGVFEGINEGEK